MKPAGLLLTCISLDIVLCALVAAMTDGIGGRGWVSDTQQLSSATCYNTSETLLESITELTLTAGLDWRELQKKMHIDVEAKGGIGQFSAEADNSFVSEIKETDYSLSVTFLEYSYATVSVELNGLGLSALTPIGIQAYQDGKNPFFNIICGDYVLQQYAKGAMLAMSVTIHLHSRDQKEKMKLHMKASYGTIVSASAAAEQFARDNHITGAFQIKALQKGGEPSQLAAILQRDESGYFALECSLQDMGRCRQAASGMLDYAVKSFSSQFSCQENRGLMYLGPGFLHRQPLWYVGLDASATLVTQEVERIREELSELLEEQKTKRDVVLALRDGYPVPWVTQSGTYHSIDELQRKLTKNVDRILQVDNPSRGAIGCFDYPDVCLNISKSIRDSLNLVSKDDLAFLEKIKYVLPIWSTLLYPNGDANSWGALILPRPLSGDYARSVTSLRVDPTAIEYDIMGNTPWGGCIHVWSEGHSSDSMTYDVVEHSTYGNSCPQVRDHRNADFHSVYTKRVSTFYSEMIDAFGTESPNKPLDLLGYM